MENLVQSQNRDLEILHAICGIDDPLGMNITIEHDYLLRERMENLRETGYAVPEDFQPKLRCAFENRVYQDSKQMEQLEETRTKRVMEWEIHDEDDESDYITPTPRVQVIVV